jgi:hypothetical protein
VHGLAREGRASHRGSLPGRQCSARPRRRADILGGARFALYGFVAFIVLVALAFAGVLLLR